MVKMIRFINSLNEVHYGFVLEHGQGEYKHLVRVFWDRFLRPSLKKQPTRLMPHISWVNPSGAVGGSRYEFGDWLIKWTVPELRRLTDGERVDIDKFLIAGGVR